MEIFLFRNLILTVLILNQGKAYAADVEVGEGNAVTITCPLNVQYPTWTGPDLLANPINDGPLINEPGITWIDDKNIKINKTMLKHDGNYTCTDGSGNSRIVDVDVQCKAYAADVEVGEGNAVTITCPLNVQYPTWTGPDLLANPINDGPLINEPGITWIDDKNIKINKTMLKHDGNYTCTDGSGNSRIVDVDVQYFQSSASFTTATDKNSTTTLSCTCFSNPSCKIVPHIITSFRDGQDDHGSVTTFKECKSDSARENRTKCSVITLMHVYKEDNGLKMSCTFNYKNVTGYLILYPKVKVLFPPTRVNISATMADTKLSVKCSTDSSNPVSSLIWRRGVSPKASMNRIIDTDDNGYVMDAEYDGKNITQTIDIDTKDIVNGENIFCCARHQSREMCDSMSLNPFQISGGSVLKYSLSTLFISILLLLV